MVLHRHQSRSYWTLPGGGVEEGETPLQAVVREVREETRLHVRVARHLFDEPFKQGCCRCFLAESNNDREIALGYDPEEFHLEAHERMLQGVAWHSLENMKQDGQVSRVLEHLAEAG